MSDKDVIRQKVEASYARAVAQRPCCCGPSSSPGPAATVRIYGAGEIEALPPEAAASSFGCGNPVAHCEMLPGQVVLDLGSGAGIDLILAAREVGPEGRVIGVDMTDSMIERARANVAAAGLRNVDVRKGLIEALPLDSGSVDWVISNCVLNLSPEKDRVFREIARVLKPGGRMVVSDIMADSLPDWVLADDALYASCIGGAIPEEEYVSGLRAAGMVDVQIRERLVYDADQLAALAGFDADTPGCCAGPGGARLGAAAVDDLAGKIWSARVEARRA